MENNILENIVRVGVVESVNPGKYTARVRFPSIGIISGNLKVIQHNMGDIHVEPDNKHSHGSGSYSNAAGSVGGESSPIPDHNHPKTHVTIWMPAVGDSVLCLYIPVENGDGYILGHIL